MLSTTYYYYTIKNELQLEVILAVGYLINKETSNVWTRIQLAEGANR